MNATTRTAYYVEDYSAHYPVRTRFESLIAAQAYATSRPGRELLPPPEVNRSSFAAKIWHAINRKG